MNTPIFVINLEKSISRKKFIIEQFEKLEKEYSVSFNYQFFLAINGKENPDFYLFKKYNEQKRFQRKGNTLNLSQLGCFASHYLLWEKCIELNQGIIILEDDAILHYNFPEVYKFTSLKDNIFEFFWLSPPVSARKNQNGDKLYTFSENYSIYKFYGPWNNTTGYYITPNAAKKLLGYCKEWIYEVDITMERYWENKIEYLSLLPFCIEPDLNFESNIIMNKGKPNRTMSIRIRREFYKMLDKYNKLKFNLKSNCRG